MHRFFICLIVISFTVIKVSAQISIKSKPLIIKTTATWCNICGASFAWSQFKEMTKTHQNDATFIAVHYSEGSDLYTPSSDSLSTLLSEAFGVPELYHNGIPAPYDGNWTASSKRFIEEVNDIPSIVDIIIDFRIKENEIQVDITNRFLEDTDKELYSAVYLVENDIVNYQNGRSSDAVHSKVLRAHLGDEVKGKLISDSGILNNDRFENSYTYDIEDGWEAENLEVISVVWEKFGNDYLVVNTNVNSEADESTPAKNLVLLPNQFKISPNIIRTQSSIQFLSNEVLEEAVINVYDTDGRLVSNLFRGRISQSNFELKINRSDLPSAGNYFITIEAAGEILTKKIIAQ